MAASNKAGTMGGPRGRASRKPADQFIIGTEEEVANRAFESGLFSTYGNPATKPTAFKQIEGQSTTGQSVNRAGLKHKGGDLKFGDIGKA